jgi:hypothetical protein
MANTRDEGLAEKEKALTAEIEKMLPDFARSCRDSTDVVIIYQDSFAAATSPVTAPLRSMRC